MFVGLSCSWKIFKLITNHIKKIPRNPEQFPKNSWDKNTRQIPSRKNPGILGFCKKPVPSHPRMKFLGTLGPGGDQVWQKVAQSVWPKDAKTCRQRSESVAKTWKKSLPAFSSKLCNRCFFSSRAGGKCLRIIITVSFSQDLGRLGYFQSCADVTKAPSVTHVLGVTE